MRKKSGTNYQLRRKEVSSMVSSPNSSIFSADADIIKKSDVSPQPQLQDQN